VVICLEQGANCLHMVQLMPLLPKIPSSLASFKSRLVLPFWYLLTLVVLEKRPLNGCSVVVVVFCLSDMHINTEYGIWHNMVYRGGMIRCIGNVIEENSSVFSQSAYASCRLMLAAL